MSSRGVQAGLVAVGLLFLYLCAQKAFLLLDGVPAQATILSIEDRQDNDIAVTFHARYEFVTQDGAKVQGTALVGAGARPHQPLALRYWRRWPALNGTAAEFGLGLWALAWLLLAVGCFVLASWAPGIAAAPERRPRQRSAVPEEPEPSPDED
jgi:hypothetical protein